MNKYDAEVKITALIVVGVVGYAGLSVLRNLSKQKSIA